jgi:hypothetical protein
MQLLECHERLLLRLHIAKLALSLRQPVPGYFVVCAKRDRSLKMWQGERWFVFIEQNATQSHLGFFKVGVILNCRFVELLRRCLIAILPAQSCQFIGRVCISRVNFNFLCKLLFGSGNIFRDAARAKLRQIGSTDTLHISIADPAVDGQL